MISYEDFDLRIQADGNGFVVSAQRGSQSVREPFDVDLPRLLDFWELEENGPVDIKELGAALFDALIRGRVRDLYHQARGGAGGDAAKGLRTRILLDPRDERLRPLLRLPWEVLFDRTADAGGLLALDPRRPIVRTIDSMEQTLPPTSEPLSQVLLALSNPNHIRSLDLNGECAAVGAALESIAARPEVLRHATRSRLRNSIRDSEPQIVHFMGHGNFDPVLQECVLLLEDEQGGRDALSASTFASLFAGRPMPWLVVLSSCHSAKAGRDPALGPFASVATALVAAGLPAVIAMQTTVRNRKATSFTERLYQRLVKGDPIEAAVSEARIALKSDRAETLDWAVPVLFMRGQAESLRVVRRSSAVPGEASPNPCFLPNGVPPETPLQGLLEDLPSLPSGLHPFRDPCHDHLLRELEDRRILLLASYHAAAAYAAAYSLVTDDHFRHQSKKALFPSLDRDKNRSDLDLIALAADEFLGENAKILLIEIDSWCTLLDSMLTFDWSIVGRVRDRLKAHASYLVMAVNENLLHDENSTARIKYLFPYYTVSHIRYLLSRDFADRAEELERRLLAGIECLPSRMDRQDLYRRVAERLAEGVAAFEEFLREIEHASSPPEVYQSVSPSVSQVVNSRDVNSQQIFGYVGHLHQGARSRGKK